LKETLIIFSRYPEPGKTKTRMIPVLGAEGAANLQRRLSENTLTKARTLSKLREIEIAVYFTGGSKILMETWLGKELNYYPQAEGDLGEKMRSAFADSFSQKSQRVVIIGIDCPSLDCYILETAFEALKNNDLVLGEAADGGYYLIGLSKLFPQLFMDINWGTSEVFSVTNRIAQQLNLAIAYLPILRDLDRPEDLEFAPY
jgi:uncharacterized protein